jgi:hypothetical protein
MKHIGHRIVGGLAMPMKLNLAIAAIIDFDERDRPVLRK